MEVRGKIPEEARQECKANSSRQPHAISRMKISHSSILKKAKNASPLVRIAAGLHSLCDMTISQLDMGSPPFSGFVAGAAVLRCSASEVTSRRDNHRKYL